MLNKRRGQGLVEYALILALIALVCVGALSTLGDTIIGSLFTHVKDNVASAEQQISESANQGGSGGGGSPP